MSLSDNFLKPEDIYKPDTPHQEMVCVPHIELSFKQAREQGWHFKLKSNLRYRITRYTGSGKNIIVPAKIDGFTVNELGRMAFQYTEAESVQIPDTIKKLTEKCFFMSCVRNVVFSDSIKIIPDETFSNCKNLQSVQLPNNLYQIGKRAFLHCKSLKYINIPQHCMHIEEEALQGSGLEGFAIDWWSVLDGSVLYGTPLQSKYKLILMPRSKWESYVYKILLVGTRADVVFSGGNVFLGKNSVAHGCSIDFSHCENICINTEAFRCKRNEYGGLMIMPNCRVILPVGERCAYIPDFVNAVYPDGTPYKSIFEENGNDTVFVHGPDLPSFSLRKNRKELNVKAKSLYFSNYAVASPMLESFSICYILGKGELFSPCCRYLHKVKWIEYKENCAYIPSAELIDERAHRELLKAFSTYKKDYKDEFFDSRVIDRVFTEPISDDSTHYLRRKPYELSQKEKILLAADVLRSPKYLFKNWDMYVEYLKTHKRYALIVCSKLPDKWKEYKDFLEKFYRKAEK